MADQHIAYKVSKAMNGRVRVDSGEETSQRSGAAATFTIGDTTYHIYFSAGGANSSTRREAIELVKEKLTKENEQ
jgi:hypothetical protein